jgi:predicted GIY-YIG superfamily endonuclease
MHSVYILKSLKGNFTYVGVGSNARTWLHRHNSGGVLLTKKFAPFKLLHTETFDTIKEAKERQLYWKTKGKGEIRRLG